MSVYKIAEVLQVDGDEGVTFVPARSFYAEQLHSGVHTIIFGGMDDGVLQRVQSELLLLFSSEQPVTWVSQQLEKGKLPIGDLATVEDVFAVYLPPTESPAVTHRQYWKLLEIIRVLRSPNGCPWDRKQTHSSLRRYVIEEAYEVADAIDRGDMSDLADELGDLWLQIALHTQIAREEGRFSIHDTLQAISDKMIRRHPHVFGDLTADDASQVVANWEAIKKQERQAKRADASTSVLSETSPDDSILHMVKVSQPAMKIAYDLQQTAATVGFEWDDISGFYEKLQEELVELANSSPAEQADEWGDVAFVVVNLARSLGIDPEEALAGANRKFRRRFGYIERMVKQSGLSLEDVSLEQMDYWWNEAKKLEKDMAAQ